MDVYSAGAPVAGSPSQAFLGLSAELLTSRRFEVGVTSIANAVRHAAGNTFLGIAVDCYYFDETVSESNVSWAAAGHAGYYKSIGPNKLNEAGDQIGDGLDGTGTWGMRRDTVYLELDGTAQIARLDFAVVIHDTDIVTEDDGDEEGGIWLTDFELRAVA
jgi:hypothetical protein